VPESHTALDLCDDVVNSRSVVGEAKRMNDIDRTYRSLRGCPTCFLPTDGRFCTQDGTITDGAFEVDGRYQVDESLGGGAMALVFTAKHLKLGKPVALKIMRAELAEDPAQAERFLRHARLGSQLSHENILAITDFGHDEDQKLIYLVMERLSGTTLDKVIKPRMPIERALRIMLQISRAMIAAHGAGVVHGDIKPRNIFLINSSGRDDQVKLCDFGLANSPDGHKVVSNTGTIIGTPAYLAPEQVRGDAGQDFRVDLYGFGCTAFELLTGRLAHHASSPGGMLASKLAASVLVSPAELVPEADIPAELDELVIRCLSSNPADRPSGFVEIEALIDGLINNTRAPSAPSTLIGQMIGSHRVTRLLGSGGIGSVYQAEHPLIGTQVAIKVLRAEIANDPQMIERFVLEARSSSTIGSPHIPRFIDFGHLRGGQPYAVMEYLDGETLGNRLRRVGLMSLDEAIEVAGQVASAMELAHARGIVHRDLKPDNIFLAKEGGREVVKVLDFGIAKLVNTGSAAKTQAGLVLGTAYYCAPEQALGLEVSPVADVYALGVTAYEMLTGQPPFQGQVSAILGAKTTQEAPLIRQLRPDLPAVVERGMAQLLAREPEARTATMTDLLEELAAWKKSVPQPALPVEEPASGQHTPLPRAPSVNPDVIAMVPRRPSADPLLPPTGTAIAPAASLTPWKRRGLVAAIVLFAAVITLLIARRDSGPTSIGSNRPTTPAASAAPAPTPAPAPAAKQPATQSVTPSAPAPATSAQPATPSPTPAPVASESPSTSDPAPGAGSGSGKKKKKKTPATQPAEPKKDGVIFDPFKD
jgi:serine/threonine protein kinase